MSKIPSQLLIVQQRSRARLLWGQGLTGTVEHKDSPLVAGQALLGVREV